MEQLDSLLQLISRLQNEASTARGRRLLLNYTRENCHARLALLLQLDKERHCLLIQARDGRRPAHTGKQSAPVAIPLNGYFGTVLHTHGLLSIPDLHAEKRALPEEQYWTWPRGPVVTCVVANPDHSALLVLCFAPDTGLTNREFDESVVLICASLLSNYLGRDRFIASASASMPVSPPSTTFLQPSVTVNEQANAFQVGNIHIQAEVERERERIARDIHDGPAQQFAAVAHRLEYTERILLRQPQDALREIGRARKMLDEGLQELRQSIATLLPARLREHTFTDALYALAGDYVPLPVAMELDPLALVPLALEAPIYRFTQEALNNIRKHAQATRASVRVHMVSGLLLVEVSDNGKGFDVTTQTRADQTPGQRFGLRTMRDRVEDVGGTMDIQSKTKQGGSGTTGTTVRAYFSVPVHSSDTLSTPVSALTKREREVLRLIIDGQTNRAIAEQLTVSLETVKSHVHHIMQKLNARDRTHAAVLATRQRWI